MFLMIDNYDSFTWNLYALFREQGAEVKVIRNDEYIPADEYDGIILSPGPSSPENSGTTLKYLDEYLEKKPFFGVCLGMQCLGYHLGYRINRAPSVQHGKVDSVQIVRDSVLFRGLPEAMDMVRYHSLSVEVEGEPVTALSASDRAVMAIENKEKMYFGVQFHPESFASGHGARVVKNFIDFVESKKIRKTAAPEGSFSLFQKITSGETLSFDEARVFFDSMLSDELTEAQIAASLISLRNRGESADEVAALVSAMDSHKKTFSSGVADAVDTCGTGGDGKSTLNVSTAVSIVLAAMDIPVVKHGNRAQSGKVGSADILEQLGLDLNYIDTPPEDFFQKHNYIFMLAPHYHPSLKRIGKVRRELKIPTIFNFVGPLVNPANPASQVIGINRLERVEFIASVLERLGRKDVTVYSSRDGYDEVSSKEPTECITLRESGLERFVIDPSDFFTPSDMPRVESAEEGRELFLAALTGSDEALANLVALNAALALKTRDGVTLEEGYARSMETITGGRAAEKLSEVTGVHLS